MLDINKSIFPTLGLVLLALSLMGTLYYIALLKPSSALALAVIAGWLFVPHLAIGAAFYARAIGFITVMVLLVLGQLFLADVVIWNQDPQGAIAVFMLPILQIFGLAVAFLLTKLAAKKAST
jgi:hypothetical protein